MDLRDCRICRGADRDDGLAAVELCFDAPGRGSSGRAQAAMIARPKHQRMVLVILALAAVLGAVLLAMWGLKDRAAYFYTPSDVVAGNASTDKAMRLGGMVERGSVQRDPDGVTTRFLVEDGEARVLVTYRGILPDLFREGL